MTKRRKYQVLLEDEDLIAINKPSGISTIPEREQKNASILNLLQSTFGEVYTIHRIDKTTSGIVIFAKNKMAHQALNQQFLNRTVTKKYLAITSHHPTQKRFTIDLAIAHSNNSAKMRVHPSGKKAISHIKVLDSCKHFSLVEIEIETGRTHQIRVHLAHKNLPIIGDEFYHPSPDVYLSTYKKKFNKGQKGEKPLMLRTALHASSIIFEHPTLQTPIEVGCELPKDMEVCWKLLKKWDI